MKILAGLKQKDAGYRFETDNYDQWQMIAVIEGKLGLTVHESDGGVQPGGAVVLPLGSAFNLWCRAGSYRGVFVILRDSQETCLSGPVRVIDINADMTGALSLIEQEARQPGERSESYLAAAGRLLMEQTVRALGAAQREGHHTPTPELWVARARPLVERSIYSSAPMRQVLGGLGIGYRQLTRHFKAVLGTTPKQYQLDCRLREACRLLSQTELSVTSIAMELGFASSQHFSAQFSRAHGRPPTAWRMT